jgi:hypothetical protein
MNQVNTFLSIAVLLMNLLAKAQTFVYPTHRNWERAIEKGTRTYTGIPGRNYWQNQAKYKLNASLSVKKSYLKGHGTITYYNNSPDTLDRLVFNIYQDIYRKGNSRDWDLGIDDLHGGTRITDLIWNGTSINPKDQSKVNRLGTKLLVRPGMKILPGDSVLIETKWEVPIPTKRTVRMGKYSDSVIFIAYWYPQIAVYDDLDGWDMISYGGSVEFYNDFNDYDVSISVPSSYVVWATGELLMPDRIFSNNILNRLNFAKESKEVVKVIDVPDYKQKKVFRKGHDKVFRFKANGISDFSFGVGSNLVWDAVSVSVDGNGRSILASAVYPSGAKHWDKVAHFSQLSIEYMSKTRPGIPFPYSHMTTMHNGKAAGGMETPMMAINGAPTSESGNFGLTFHEIAHTYMPFYMGTNEKKYAWMDEGWATLWPHTLVDSLFPGANYLENLIRGYEQVAGTENDLPPMIPNQFMAANYSSLRLGTYVRPAVAYYFLEQTLGSELFTKALHFYMSTWNGKHPSPIDFFASFEHVADTDLSWYFRPWFYTSAYPDLSLRKITSNNQLVVENIGGLPLPVHIKVIFVDDSSEEIMLNTDVWRSGERTILVPLNGKSSIREAEMNSRLIPDVNRKDNKLLIIDKNN